MALPAKLVLVVLAIVVVNIIGVVPIVVDAYIWFDLVVVLVVIADHIILFSCGQ